MVEAYGDRLAGDVVEAEADVVASGPYVAEQVRLEEIAANVEPREPVAPALPLPVAAEDIGEPPGLEDDAAASADRSQQGGVTDGVAAHAHQPVGDDESLDSSEASVMPDAAQAARRQRDPVVDSPRVREEGDTARDEDAGDVRPGSDELRGMHSGMPIADSPQRQNLTNILVTADTTYFAGNGDPAKVAKANEIAAQVGEVEGVEVVRPGDFDSDRDNDCAHHAFGELKGEPWAAPHTRMPKELWRVTRHGGPLTFLERNGYAVVDGQPVADDVVAYTSASADEVQAGSAAFKHFGVLGADGRVESKFAQGPVATHPVDLVPSIWGSTAYFLRKPEAESAGGDVSSDGHGVGESESPAEGLARLRSGMQVADSYERQGLADLLKAADTTWQASNGDPGKILKARAIADVVGDFDGVELLQGAEFGTEDDEDEVAEPTGRDVDSAVSPDVEQNVPSDRSMDRLGQQGWSVIDDKQSPAAGHVVGYTNATSGEVSAGQAEFLHFGVLQPDGTAISRFGKDGPVVRHDVALVPSDYGAQAYFLQRDPSAETSGDGGGPDIRDGTIIGEYAVGRALRIIDSDASTVTRADLQRLALWVRDRGHEGNGGNGDSPQDSRVVYTTSSDELPTMDDVRREGKMYLARSVLTPQPAFEQFLGHVGVALGSSGKVKGIDDAHVSLIDHSGVFRALSNRDYTVSGVLEVYDELNRELDGIASRRTNVVAQVDQRKPYVWMGRDRNVLALNLAPTREVVEPNELVLNFFRSRFGDVEELQRTFLPHITIGVVGRRHITDKVAREPRHLMPDVRVLPRIHLRGIRTSYFRPGQVRIA